MISEALLNLKASIEEAGGICKIVIEIEDKNTFEIVKEHLQGLFNYSGVEGELEGFDGIKLWHNP